MKTLKLTIGIISMVLFLIIAFQSCAVGIGNTITDNGETSGSGGVLLSILMLIGGIVAVCGRNSKPATIVATVFYALGGIIGISNVGTFSDLKIWSVISLIFAALFLVCSFKMKSNVKNVD